MRLWLAIAIGLGTVAGFAADGSIVLHGRDARVRGTKLRYEPEPYKQTLGFWTQPDDAAEWTFAVARPGDYEIEVLQGCGAGQGGSVMRITLDGGAADAPGPIEFTVEETGHFQAFKPRAVGRVALSAASHVLHVQPRAIAKAACCDIREIRLVPVVSAPRPARPPNIICMLSAGHARHAISCYGSKVNATPHLDRLAAAGMRFSNAFATSARCPPIQAAPLAGYHSGLVGAWRSGPLPSGFDRWIILSGEGGPRDPTFRVPGGTLSIAGHSTDIIGDLGIEFIRTRPTDKPFFLVLHQDGPHREWSPDDRNRARFATADFPAPATLLDDHATRPAVLPGNRQSLARDLTPRDLKQEPPAGLEGDALVRWKYRRFMQDYLACVQGIDDNVGKLLDHLEEAGLTDDTVVIYASCNGAYLGDLGLFGSGFMYEPGIRLPLIVRGPGIPAGTVADAFVADAFVADVDLAPTCVELAGLPVPESMAGRSVAPLLWAAPPAGWRRSVLCRGVADSRQPGVPAFVGVRTPTHKLIHYPQQDAWELFDLGVDPHEQHNLLFDAAEATSRGVANTFKALKAEMARLQGAEANDGSLADPAASPPPAAAEHGGDGEPRGMKTIAEAIDAAAARRIEDRAGGK